MSLPSTDHRGPFASGYSELQSDLLTLGKFGAATELAAFLKKHAFSSVDAAFPQAFGHSEDRSRARARVSTPHSSTCPLAGCCTLLYTSTTFLSFVI